MRENRTCGSEGGEAQSLPYPYPGTSIGQLNIGAEGRTRTATTCWSLPPQDSVSTNFTTSACFCLLDC